MEISRGAKLLAVIIWCKVGYVLSSHMLSKNIKVRVYKTINLLFVSYVYETWSLTLMGGSVDEEGTRENIGPMGENVKWSLGELLDEELQEFYSS